MEKQRQVVCNDNKELANFIWDKRQEMAQRSKGISENIDMTLYKAYSNVCNCKNPITTIKEFAKIKGVGKWILRLMQGFFGTDSSASENEELTKKGKKINRTKRYMPQKNSVAYSLLITLYRGTSNGSNFMRKQELIDAAEASGLSRAPIMPEKGKGKPSQFGSSPREWYTGWSCMKTLITKGLVVKSSNPAKYMLTDEGKEAARECLLRSGLDDSMDGLAAGAETLNLDKTNNISGPGYACADSVEELQHIGSSRQTKSFDVPQESLDRFVCMGYSKEQIIRAFSEVSEVSGNKDISSLWPAVLCCLREEQIYGLPFESRNTQRDHHLSSSATYRSRDTQVVDLVIGDDRPMNSSCDGTSYIPKSSRIDSTNNSFTLKACSSTDYHVHKLGGGGFETKSNILSVPPLTFGERFEEVYEVILILDDREKFTSQGAKSMKIVEHICTQFKIQIEVRRLPIGDGIWIARHKHFGSEYVLDFIVERKKIDDLRSSIRDNRYRDQKVRLLRCGLKKLIYLVEGDANASEAAESIKTACFTTEILEGFDVQRTSGLGDTLRKYGHLTQAITQYYKSMDYENEHKSSAACPPFNEFIKRCQDLDKMTVSDVFAIQLMQVPQVTEEIAIAVLDLYPTLLSLAHAYSLEGDVCAQEEMLKQQSNNVISGVASRNIFQLVWGS
ncbi:hypothetical protein LguiA_010755 [Lonicera macranthoides]